MGGIKGCVWHPGNEQACRANRFLHSVGCIHEKRQPLQAPRPKSKSHRNMPNIALHIRHDASTANCSLRFSCTLFVQLVACVFFKKYHHPVVYQLQCFSYHHDNMQGREMEKDVWTLKFRSWTLVQCSAVACDQPCMQRKNKTPGYYPSSIDLLLYCIRIDRDVPREECQMEQGDGPNFKCFTTPRRNPSCILTW
jgi:hypothetical protein